MAMAQRNQYSASASGTRNAAPEVDDDDAYQDGVDADDDPNAAEARVSSATAPASGPDGSPRCHPEQADGRGGAACAVAGELPPHEINAWIVQLSKLAVDDAVELIRETIRKTTAEAGAGDAS